MEPISAVELFKKAPQYGLKYSTYTGDDDSTTELYINQQVPYGVEKFSDIIQIKRSLTTGLYNLGKTAQFKDSSTLSPKVIEYLVKCFSIVVTQNNSDPEAMKSYLKCIVPHSFGDHSSCDTWCRYKQDPTNYQHANLPYGRDLCGSSLKSALVDLFSQYYSDAVIRKLAPVGNSQRNESFNSTVGSKAPKIRYYGGSESNDFRVACAVAQTNIGYGYVCRTLEALGTDPGLNCTKHAYEMAWRKRKIVIYKEKNQFHVSNVEINYITKEFKGLLEKKNGKAKPMNQMLV